MKRSSPRRPRGLTPLVVLATLLGIWAFLAPLGAGEGGTLATSETARAVEAPLLFLLLAGLCGAMMVVGLESGHLDSRRLAMLGMLVGVNAVLRLLPGPPGFSAVFFLPIVTGFVLGADFGFLLGALSMLVSALLTNGLGPWVPFQMLGAGWVGLVAGWWPRWPRWPKLEIAQLTLWGAVSGILFGVVLNLWFWPVLDPTASTQRFEPGAGVGANLVGYGLYYLATSLWWDLGRALGNAVLLLAVGAPVVRLLRRFEGRFGFRWEDPAVNQESARSSFREE